MRVQAGLLALPFSASLPIFDDSGLFRQRLLFRYKNGIGKTAAGPLLILTGFPIKLKLHLKASIPEYNPLFVQHQEAPCQRASRCARLITRDPAAPLKEEFRNF
jgi:hypothetical protein